MLALVRPALLLNQLFVKIPSVSEVFTKEKKQTQRSKPVFASASLPLVNLIPFSIILKFSDKPSQPGELEILSISKDSVTLQWEKPECDGGKEILGYWVEYRQSGDSAWKKSNKERIKDRQFTIGGLLEATEYEFRVFAENETGLSRPRRTAMSVKTKLTCK